MTIRPVEPRDAAAWARMRASLWPDADPAALAAEAEAFVSRRSSALVAVAFVADEGPAGLLGFIELAIRPFSDGCTSMPVPHVEGWYVEQSARGQRVGARLMQAAETWARDLGFTELASDAEITNANSLRAHAACGFEEVERLVKFRKPLV